MSWNSALPWEPVLRCRGPDWGERTLTSLKSSLEVPLTSKAVFAGSFSRFGLMPNVIVPRCLTQLAWLTRSPPPPSLHPALPSRLLLLILTREQLQLWKLSSVNCGLHRGAYGSGRIIPRGCHSTALDSCRLNAWGVVWNWGSWPPLSPLPSVAPRVGACLPPFKLKRAQSRDPTLCLSSAGRDGVKACWQLIHLG